MQTENQDLVFKTMEYYSALPGRYNFTITELGPGIIFVRDHYQETNERENDIYFDLDKWRYIDKSFEILTEGSDLGKVPSWIFDEPIKSLEEAVTLVCTLLTPKLNITLYDQPRQYPLAQA